MIETAIAELEKALLEYGVHLEFIKVDNPLYLDGKEVATVMGIPIKQHIGEHEADYFLMAAPKPQADGGGKDGGDDTV